MTAREYREILDFIGDKSKCYVVLKKEKPQLYEKIDREVEPSSKIKIDGCISVKGNYILSGFNPKRENGNSILIKSGVLPKDLIKECRTLTKVQVQDASLRKKKALKNRRENCTHILEQIEANQSNPLPSGIKIPHKYKNKTPKENYLLFLDSDYWAYVRKIKLEQSHYKCQLCGGRQKLNVHHNTYEHHYNEHSHLEDLVVLCDKCHAKFHNKLKH